MITGIAVPILIFVFCLLAGVMASSRWLPELAPGMAGGLAFFVVSGLVGSALGVIGLRLYTTIEEASGQPTGSLRNIYIADGLTDLLWESGVLLGMAIGVYLLAQILGGSDREPASPSET